MRRLLALALGTLLLALPALAAPPTFVANGAATVSASATTCTVDLPVSCTDDDILILVGCGEGDGAGGTLALTTANGFAAFTGVTAVSDDDNDATEENPENDCMVWWKRTSGGCGSAPVITDSGDHTTCQVHQFRGVKTTGDPHNTAGQGTDGNDTSASLPGVTTTAADTLIVLVQGTSNNATATTNCGAVTNADLTSITERFDSTNTQGLGGGHCIITGVKASAGSVTNSTLTLSATSFKAAFTIALEPPGAPAACQLSTALMGVGCR